MKVMKMFEEVQVFFFFFQNLGENGGASFISWSLTLVTGVALIGFMKMSRVVVFRSQRNTMVFSIYSGNKKDVKKIYCQLLQMSILGLAWRCRDRVTIKISVVEIIKAAHSLLRRNPDQTPEENSHVVWKMMKMSIQRILSEAWSRAGWSFCKRPSFFLSTRGCFCN